MGAVPVVGGGDAVAAAVDQGNAPVEGQAEGGVGPAAGGAPAVAPAAAPAAAPVADVPAAAPAAGAGAGVGVAAGEDAAAVAIAIGYSPVRPPLEPAELNALAERQGQSSASAAGGADVVPILLELGYGDPLSLLEACGGRMMLGPTGLVYSTALRTTAERLRAHDKWKASAFLGSLDMPGTIALVTRLVNQIKSDRSEWELGRSKLMRRLDEVGDESEGERGSRRRRRSGHSRRRDYSSDGSGSESGGERRGSRPLRRLKGAEVIATAAPLVEQQMLMLPHWTPVGEDLAVAYESLNSERPSVPDLNRFELRSREGRVASGKRNASSTFDHGRGDDGEAELNLLEDGCLTLGWAGAFAAGDAYQLTDHDEASGVPSSALAPNKKRHVRHRPDDASDSEAEREAEEGDVPLIARIGVIMDRCSLVRRLAKPLAKRERMRLVDAFWSKVQTIVFHKRRTVTTAVVEAVEQIDVSSFSNGGPSSPAARRSASSRGSSSRAAPSRFVSRPHEARPRPVSRGRPRKSRDVRVPPLEPLPVSCPRA